MYYRGRRVSLSEKESRFHGFNGASGSRTPGENKPGRFSLKLFEKSEGPEEKKEQKKYAFYRPGVTQGEDTPSSEHKGRGGVPQAGWFSRTRWVFHLLFLGAIGMAVLWSKTKTTDLLQQMFDLKLSRVSVEGVRYLSEDQVLKAARLPMGQNMFQLDLEGACDRIRQLDWVERVYVERRLPQSLLISVRERKPLALADNGALYGVDREGRVLSAATALLREDLPLISGLKIPPEAVGTTALAEALKPALDFFSFLKKKDEVLAQDVSEVNLSEPECLKVTFIDGIEAKFNFTVSDAELRRMAAVISDLSQKGKRTGTMDFRYRDMVLVKTR